MGVGAAVQYECTDGYRTQSLTNTSECDESGLWEDIALTCEGCMKPQCCVKVQMSFKNNFKTETGLKSLENNIKCQQGVPLHWQKRLTK